MPGWKCYLITPAPFVRRKLRRFYFADEARTAEITCPVGPMSAHDASVLIEPQLPHPVESSAISGPPRPDHYATDPRWPTICGQCGVRLPSGPIEQVNDRRLYDGFPDGQLRALDDKDTPPGAVYHADWLDDHWPTLNGKSYGIVLPGGHGWIPSIPAANSNTPWHIEGPDPLHLTTTPSINPPDVYHGYLTGGVLQPDCEGRQFPQWPYTVP